MTTANKRVPLPLPLATMIGSLPHHNADAALEVSLRTPLPFLPQIPIRNPAEYMIAQALEGLPGLEAGRDGVASLHVDRWTAGTHAFKQKLKTAFANAARGDAFEEFLPSPLGASAWKPFLWEIEERGLKFAKAQIAGPLTSQAVLRLESADSGASLQELTSQVFRLVLARATAMIREIQRAGAQPVFFVDEPGLSAVPLKDPRGLLALQELRILIQSLKKEGAWVGLHCCGDADWGPLLTTAEPDFLSIDCDRSLSSLLSEPDVVKTFLASGGRLALGLIPTQTGSFHASSFDASAAKKTVREMLAEKLGKTLEEAESYLREAIYTPACGLAFHSPEDVESVLTALEALTPSH